MIQNWPVVKNDDGPTHARVFCIRSLSSVRELMFIWTQEAPLVMATLSTGHALY